MTTITLERSVQAILARITENDLDAARQLFERAVTRHEENTLLSALAAATAPAGDTVKFGPAPAVHGDPRRNGEFAWRCGGCERGTTEPGPWGGPAASGGYRTNEAARQAAEEHAGMDAAADMLADGLF